MAARTLGKNIQNTSVIRKYNDTDLLNHFHFACVLTKTGNTLWPFLYATPICMPSITGEVLLQGGKHVPRVCSHICNVLGKITVLLTHCIPVVRIPQCLAFSHRPVNIMGSSCILSGSSQIFWKLFRLKHAKFPP